MTSLVVEALELEVLRNPASVKTWLQLVNSVQGSDYSSSAEKANATNIVYERAIRANSFSYKLWVSYIAYRRDNTKTLSSSHEWFRALRGIYERALEKLPMMPVLWTSFIEFLMDASLPVRLTLTRHTIIRALKALPLTQHNRVWKLAKKWTRLTHVPIETAKYLWRLYLLFDPRAENQRDYFLMLSERGNTSEFLDECTGVLIDGAPHEDLLTDVTFWETIRLALETTELCFSGDLNRLEKMVYDVALQHCASKAEFMMSYAVFLASQGEFSKTRRTLWTLLEDAEDMDIFSSAFSMAVTFEEQIIDSLAMDSSIQSLDIMKYRYVFKKLCNDVADPLDYLLRLINEHPLLLNQVQLRLNRSDTAMWLKRAELLRENVYNNMASTSDVVALYRQAITQFTSGQQRIDSGAAQLFESYACYLWDIDRKADAIAVVTDAAWHLYFHSASVNVILMGLFIEFALLLWGREKSLSEFLLKLQGSKTAMPQSTIRSHKGLATSVVLSHLREDPRAWMLVIDVAFCGSEETLGHIVEAYTKSSGYSAEGACYVAGRLWHAGKREQAFREFERALVLFRDAPLAMLYVLQQYLSCLCLFFGDRLPLYRLRELTRLGVDAARATLHLSSVASVEFLLNCAALELRLGLAGVAVDVVRGTLQLALQCRNCADAVLLGILDTLLDMVLSLQGSQALRQCCVDLLGRKQLPSYFIERVTLWWAAVEVRTGNKDKAHSVLEACCKSQDPSTGNGRVFWDMWESICTTASQFEDVHKRKQQVALKYKNTSASNTTTIV